MPNDTPTRFQDLTPAQAKALLKAYDSLKKGATSYDSSLPFDPHAFGPNDILALKSLAGINNSPQKQGTQMANQTPGYRPTRQEWAGWKAWAAQNAGGKLNKQTWDAWKASQNQQPSQAQQPQQAQPQQQTQQQQQPAPPPPKPRRINATAIQENLRTRGVDAVRAALESAHPGEGDEILKRATGYAHDDPNLEAAISHYTARNPSVVSMAPSQYAAPNFAASQNFQNAYNQKRHREGIIGAVHNYPDSASSILGMEAWKPQTAMTPHEQFLMKEGGAPLGEYAHHLEPHLIAIANNQGIDTWNNRKVEPLLEEPPKKKKGLLKSAPAGIDYNYGSDATDDFLNIS